MKNLRQYIQRILKENYEVRGYIKPDSSFFTLNEWQFFCEQMLSLQEKGFDTRGGGISLNDHLIALVNQFFDYQLNTEVNQYELLTYKNIMDFIEDFINHRFWGFKREFSQYFPNIDTLRFAYFYSRGDIEPYVLLDENWTTQFYGTNNNIRAVRHWTSETGLKNLENALSKGNMFDISSFTILPANKEFFDYNSNYLVTLEGNVRAGFRSDIKSFAVDSGRRACNLYRLEYPGHDLTNICTDLDSCDLSNRTSIWNEYIVTPIRILSVEKVR